MEGTENHMQQYLTASCEPLCLLVEEPEVGRPEEAVEEAKEDRDVALGELRARAATLNLHFSFDNVHRGRVDSEPKRGLKLCPLGIWVSKKGPICRSEC